MVMMIAGLAFLLALLFPGSLCAESRVLFDGDSIYGHITVTEEGRERCLFFGRYSDSRQTCLDLTEPARSVFEYTAMMFVGFLFQPETRNVALIGLGGGYLPTFFRMRLPAVRLDTIEIDPLVYKLAQNHFSLKTTPIQSVTIADGRQYLKHANRQYDQIWVDAFNTDYIPLHLTTKEFLQQAKSCLTKNGVVVQNVHNSNKLYDAHVTTFRAAFAHVFVFQGARSGNVIIVGSDNPLFTPSTFKQIAKSKLKIGEIDLLAEAGKYVPDPIISEVSVLTDDFNPANLLLHQTH